MRKTAITLIAILPVLVSANVDIDIDSPYEMRQAEWTAAREKAEGKYNTPTQQAVIRARQAKEKRDLEKLQDQSQASASGRMSAYDNFLDRQAKAEQARENAKLEAAAAQRTQDKADAAMARQRMLAEEQSRQIAAAAEVDRQKTLKSNRRTELEREATRPARELALKRLKDGQITRAEAAKQMKTAPQRATDILALYDDGSISYEEAMATLRDVNKPQPTKPVTR